jgi:site-specific recombinase XerD
VPVRYLEHLRLRGLSPDTIAARRRTLTRLARVLPCGIFEAGPAELLAWRGGLTVSPDVIAHYVSHARLFYAWAVAEGLAVSNPAAALPVPPKSRRLPRPVAEEDLTLSLKAAPPRIRPWLVLAAWAGLRAKEIALLRRECVLYADRLILVAADATKGHTERLVPMSAFVAAELAAAGLPRAGWCFPRRDGRPGPVPPHIVSQLAGTFLHDCGIGESLHSLRHRFATQAYRASGHDLRAVQELLGHRHITSTAGYAAYDQAAAAAAVEAIPVPDC